MTFDVGRTKCVQILGTRGIPAQHGGFETFAEKFALFLAKRGWQVSVYCQADPQQGPEVSCWNGVELVHIPAPSGSIGSIWFDFKSVLHAARRPGVALTLGYNTAVFCLILKLFGKPTAINMDGIEWKRAKWGALAKLWFYLNEHCGQLFNKILIADHPEIKAHLQRFRFYRDFLKKEIVVIPYGGEPLADQTADPRQLEDFGIKLPYCIVIARPEPENSIDLIVRAFSQASPDAQLVLLGHYSSEHPYHRLVKSLANDRVLFPGAIYDKELVAQLRQNAAFYIHGHTVGGTNPSLVEALAAKLPVLAHHNAFNQWVAQDAAIYFSDAQTCAAAISELFNDPEKLSKLTTQAGRRYEEAFQWDSILKQYEEILLDLIPS